MKTAAKVITRDSFDSASLRNGYAFESLLAVCGDRPTVCGKWNASDISFQMERLKNLGGPAKQCHAKLGQASPGCLLANHRYLGAMLAEVRRNRQEQRTGASDDHTFAANRQATLDHCLQTTGTHHVGQCPTRKR
jgi:hypothetical protein